MSNKVQIKEFIKIMFKIENSNFLFPNARQIIFLYFIFLIDNFGQICYKIYNKNFKNCYFIVIKI